ncbi:DUF4249 family protein [Salinibacter altiplanensis]|uniref:DUF4249 family protein n=1 Tax=Salinibacter altiplanensis TaxID=1803181 RepID=UPI000C9F7755|nr:DUF4249 family protein [Salinibacter altiplanensis]
MHRLLLLFLSALLAVGPLGCDTTAPAPKTQVVVEAYLQGGAAMPPIRLTRSVGTEEAYVASETAVREATVEVRRRSGNGSPADTLGFVEQEPGVYRPRDTSRVRPGTTYELSVVTPDGTDLTATTTVPDAISIVEAANTTAVYRDTTRQPSFTITPPDSSREQQAVLVITSTSLADFGRPESQLVRGLTPFYADIYDADEDSLRTYRTTSSGVRNEANFTRDASGRITTDLPWISVAFYGPNEIGVHVIDDNLFNLIRSQQAQSPGGPGGGLGPGEIPNVIEAVDGGTGVFASYTKATRNVSIRCSPSLADAECPAFAAFP